MKLDWKLIDGLLLLAAAFLFIGGQAIGTGMSGINDFTTATLTVSGDITTHASAGTEPQAAIVMFDTSCPTGWTRQTQFDGAIPYGAATYSATPGGSSTHSHTMSSHTHSTNTISFASGGSHSHSAGSSGLTNYVSGHTHMQPGTAYPINNGTSYTGTCAGYQTDSGGAHTHTVTFSTTGSSSHSHSVSGGISAASDTFDSTTSTPAYARLVFCKKN